MVKDQSDSSDADAKIELTERESLAPPAKSEDPESCRTFHADYGSDRTGASNDGARLTHVDSHGRASMVDVSKVGRPPF